MHAPEHVPHTATPKVLYLGGTGRSGSTLLARLLGAMPGYAPVGELRYVWTRGFAENHLCECGRAFRECPFWTAVVDDAFGGFDRVDVEGILDELHEVDRIRYVPALLAARSRTTGFRTHLRNVADAIGRFYASIAAVSGRPVVVDSSKDPSYAFLLRAMHSTGALDVAVAQLVRDSRAVAYSWTRTRRRPEIHWRNATMARRPPVTSALLWDTHNVLFEMYQRSNRPFLRVRYEDLVARPDDVASAVAALHGTDASAEGPELGHSISGNPMRFDRGPLRVRLDDEWIDAMPPADRNVVTAVTAPFLMRYGYPLRGH